MLLLDVSRIPLEGTDIDTAFSASEAHVEGEDMVKFESGGLRVHVDRDEEGTVHVKGHLTVRLGLECSRCLEPISFALDQDVDLFFLPHSPNAGDDEEDEVELSERDLVVAYYRGDRLDLGEVVREQLFLSLPMKRLCQDACQGLCLSCGVNRNRTTCDCVADTRDPRLAPLKKLLE
jgi:uncharacterized protein